VAAGDAGDPGPATETAPAPETGQPADERVDALSATAPATDPTAETVQQHPTFRAKGLEEPQRRQQQLQYSAPSETGEVEHRAGSVDDELSPEQLKGVSRNGPCPCGSGKKFKMCHGRKA
jgi:preprotein translocase subunit SecA